MKNKAELERLLKKIDGSGYPAYKQTQGQWDFEDFILSIDHVQGDPFASPSHVRILVEGKKAGFPGEYYRREKDYRRIALQDFLLRCFSRELSGYNRQNAGSGKSGLLETDRPGQEILDRSALQINEDGKIILCINVGFPAHGRRINSHPLITIFSDILPRIIDDTLLYVHADKKKLKEAIDLSDDQNAIREYLKTNGLVSFIRDGACLPRQSGVSELPLSNAILFESPKSLAIELELPHAGRVTGMGIKKGVTLIIGGGYHGKSTLLSAIERGVYNHISRDGREYVITVSDATKNRAEDGRSIINTDISLFIKGLPDGSDTGHFSSENASGSTSQAAGIVEAIESKSTLLLLDEDTCATNLMVRDEIMQNVVAKDKEPIKPFVDRVRGLYRKFGMSSILVAGSSGAFFGVADTIIRMDAYRAYDCTDEARESYKKYSGINSLPVENEAELPDIDFSRKPMAPGWIKKTDARIKTRINGVDEFSIGHDDIDLRGMEQVVCPEMTMGIMLAVKKILLKYMNGKRTMMECVDALMQEIDDKGAAALFEKNCHSGVVVPRSQEILQALARYRGIKK